MLISFPVVQNYHGEKKWPLPDDFAIKNIA